MGFVIIDIDEYKELILAKEELTYKEKEISELSDELFNLSVEKREIETELKELLLEITKGNNRTNCDEEGFLSYEVASNYVMAEFINDNYLENGILKFRKVKKENLSKEVKEEKENTNE